jgi:hypothetical protein
MFDAIFVAIDVKYSLNLLVISRLFVKVEPFIFISSIHEGVGNEIMEIFLYI